MVKVVQLEIKIVNKIIFKKWFHWIVHVHSFGKHMNFGYVDILVWPTSQTDTVLTLLPEYRGYPSVTTLVNGLRKQIYSMPRDALTHTTLSEKNWSANFIWITSLSLKVQLTYRSTKISSLSPLFRCMYPCYFRFHYAARTWEAVKKSQLMAEYNRLLHWRFSLNMKTVICSYPFNLTTLLKIMTIQLERGEKFPTLYQVSYENLVVF